MIKLSNVYGGEQPPIKEIRARIEEILEQCSFFCSTALLARCLFQQKDNAEDIA